MKKIYKLTSTTKPDLYFSTLKKAHSYLVETDYRNVTASFAQFKRWFFTDNRYEVGMNGDCVFPIDLL